MSVIIFLLGIIDKVFFKILEKFRIIDLFGLKFENFYLVLLEGYKEFGLIVWMKNKKNVV